MESKRSISLDADGVALAALLMCWHALQMDSPFADRSFHRRAFDALNAAIALQGSEQPFFALQDGERSLCLWVACELQSATESKTPFHRRSADIAHAFCKLLERVVDGVPVGGGVGWCMNAVDSARMLLMGAVKYGE